jgi:hypothetical protein
LACALVRATRLKDWNTNPIRRLRILASWFSDSEPTSVPPSR